MSSNGTKSDGTLTNDDTSNDTGAEPGGVAAVLRHAGAAVAAVVGRVHGAALCGEGVDEGRVPPGVLTDAVQELHDSPRLGLRRVDIEEDRDAVGIDELGHAQESMRTDAATRRIRCAPWRGIRFPTLFSKTNELG